MAWRGLKTVIFRMKGGGGLTAALFCTSFASVFAASVILTATFLAPRDTLVRVAPPESAVYIHADGRAASTPISVVLTKGLRPDEAAAFAVPTPDGDLLWGRLFRWRAPHRPSQAEKRALEGMGATELDARTWLVGQPEALLRVTAAHGASLADDPEANRALALVRRLFPWQAYINPSSFPAERLLGGAAWLKQVDAFAAGFFPDGSSALAVPADAPIAASSAALPLRIKSAARHAAASSVTLTGRALPFDFAVALLDKQLGLTNADELGNSAQLASARAELGRIFAEPNEISVVSPKTTSLPDFIARYRDLDREEAESVILRYMSASVPQKREIVFPDGSKAVEYWNNPNEFNFVASKGDERLKRLENDEGKPFNLFVWSDGLDTIVTSSAGLISAPPVTEQKLPCSRLSGPELMLDSGMMRRLIVFLSIKPRYWDLLPDVGHFIELDCGLIAFCG